MGSIVMTEIKVDNIVDVAGTGKPNFPVAPTHSTGSALSTLNTYQYDTTTRVVTVVDDNGTNKFAIDGVTAPTITLLRGVTYTFDVSDSSVSTHPLAFKNAGTSYTTGITSSGTAGTANATVTFVVAADAPLTGLTYYCTTHGDGMGSSVTTSDPKNGAMLWDGTSVNFYVDSEFKSIGTSDSGGGGSSSNWNVSLSNVSYDSKSLSVSSQDLAPHDVATNDDGTKIYMIGNQNDTIYQYSLSTANDISTASYDNVSLDVTSQGTPRGLVFSTDGTKMYMCEATNPDEIHQYDLSTAFDLSTASYNNVKLDIQSQLASASGVRFNNDGTRMFSCGPSNQNIYQYDLSTAFDLSTASYNNESYSGHLTQENNVMAICFSGDGTKMYVVGQQNDTIYQYGLSTAWDITTASYDNLSLSVNSQDGSPSGITFSRDGTKLFYVGYTTDTIYQYSTGVGSGGGGGGSGIAWGGTRALRFGGNIASPANATNTIDYYDISATGNATDFGDLIQAEYGGSAASSGTRAFKAGGYKTGSGFGAINNIEYVTVSTPGNATDFGDMTESIYSATAVSDSTRGCMCGGYSATSSSYTSNIEYITIATTGNATDLGAVLSGNRANMAGWNDATRGVLGGGESPTTNQIQYFTIQSSANALDFGDLGETWKRAEGAGDSTRMLFMGGRRTNSGNSNNWSNAIEYVTMQTTGDSTDFGDLINYCDQRAGSSDGTYACVAGGNVNGSISVDIDRVTVQTTGNATDHGDLTQANERPNGASGNAS